MSGIYDAGGASIALTLDLDELDSSALPCGIQQKYRKHTTDIDDTGVGTPHPDRLLSSWLGLATPRLLRQYK